MKKMTATKAMTHSEEELPVAKEYLLIWNNSRIAKIKELNIKTVFFTE